MKKLMIAAALTMGLSAAPALADDHVEVTQTNARGHATMVMMDGKEYAVCTNESQDSCIQPREIGLGWGDRPLDHWPGKPASSM